MFTLRNVHKKQTVVLPKLPVTSAEVMEFIARMRAVAVGDIQLATLSAELEEHLPATAKPADKEPLPTLEPPAHPCPTACDHR